MSLADMLPSVKALPREDKLRLLQFLTQEILSEEGLSLHFADKSVPIWSPFDAYEGAAALLSVVEQEKTTP